MMLSKVTSNGKVFPGLVEDAADGPSGLCAQGAAWIHLSVVKGHYIPFHEANARADDDTGQRSELHP